jgi:hypothetical protein
MKNLFLLLGLSINLTALAQISTKSGIFAAKEFSKEIALYKAKAFTITDILGVSDKVVAFQIDPLAAASSGELTSLVYQCDEKSKEGMILGFYGDTWNAAGVRYQAFAFKDLPKEKALELLDKIEKTIEQNARYLAEDGDNNNVYFQYDDILLLIYKGTSTKIRVFWNEFDSEWDITAFKRTKRRLQHKLD